MSFSIGATLALRSKFSASQFWDDCRKYNATVIQYIGELLRYLCNTPQKPNDRDHKVKIALGNGLRGDVWREFIKRFGDIHVYEFYASTEGNSWLCTKVEGNPSHLCACIRIKDLTAVSRMQFLFLKELAGFCGAWWLLPSLQIYINSETYNLSSLPSPPFLPSLFFSYLVNCREIFPYLTLALFSETFFFSSPVPAVSSLTVLLSLTFVLHSVTKDWRHTFQDM